jgi:hypothetical protein
VQTEPRALAVGPEEFALPGELQPSVTPAWDVVRHRDDGVELYVLRQENADLRFQVERLASLLDAERQRTRLVSSDLEAAVTSKTREVVHLRAQLRDLNERCQALEFELRGELAAMQSMLVEERRLRFESEAAVQALSRPSSRPSSPPNSPPNAATKEERTSDAVVRVAARPAVTFTQRYLQFLRSRESPGAPKRVTQPSDAVTSPAATSPLPSPDEAKTPETNTDVAATPPPGSTVIDPDRSSSPRPAPPPSGATAPQSSRSSSPRPAPPPSGATAPQSSRSSSPRPAPPRSGSTRSRS